MSPEDIHPLSHRQGFSRSTLPCVETSVFDPTVAQSCQEGYHLYGLPKSHLIPDNPPGLLVMQLPQPTHASFLVTVKRQSGALGELRKERIQAFRTMVHESSMCHFHLSSPCLCAAWPRLASHPLCRK